jgi:hypothetical protein
MGERLWSIEYSVGTVLILSFVALFVGALMYWIRGGIRGGAPPTHIYFVWERSFIIAAVVLTAVGLALLEGLLENSAGRVLARVGAIAYLFGGVLVVAAEASSLSQDLNRNSSQQNWAPAIIYVVLALVAQAAVGGALLQANLLPAWIGWATVVWNLGWLLAFLIKRGDIYIPFVHHLMPLVIGIGLVSHGA